jgi:hypothetical protein
MDDGGLADPLEGIMENTNSRLGWVLTLLALIGAATGCGDPATPTVTGPSALSRTLGSESFVAHTSGEEEEATFHVGPELAAVRQATVRFHDISAAYAAGYTTQFEPCVEIPGTGLVMGVHARHDALMADQTVDALRPELLLYEPKSNGGLKLVGVEYFQVVLVHDGDPSTDDEPKAYFGTDAPPADRIVGATPQLFGRPFDGPMPGHIEQMPWHWDLHAWIWHANPNGIFADFNPTIRCR